MSKFCTYIEQDEIYENRLFQYKCISFETTSEIIIIINQAKAGFYYILG